MDPQPFTPSIPAATLAEAERRLRQTRYPLDVANADWSYGTNAQCLADLVEHWLTRYEWDREAAAMSAYPHYRVRLGDVPVHFMHAPGRGPDPMPLLLTHGWPWTFWDFRDVVGPLSDPAAHGGDPADAFDVVVPSLPGFGFSTPLEVAGVDFTATARLWRELMVDVLGYPAFAASGGDWGNLITVQLGHRHPEALIGIHTSGKAANPGMFAKQRPWDPWGDTLYALPEEYRPGFIAFQAQWASHVATQTQDPQSLAYAMHDSPAGTCAWLLERRRAWSDCRGDVERCFDKDFLITSTLLYWATGAFVSSVRFYREACLNLWQPARPVPPLVEVPTGMTVFTREVPELPEEMAAAHRSLFPNTHYLDERAAGGHFSAMEQPRAVIDGIRATFRPLR